MLQPYQNDARYEEARKMLGLAPGDNNIYLGLFAAASADDNPNDFTDEEADYAFELAKRAQTRGDMRFAGKDINEIKQKIDNFNRLDKDILRPGEKESRAGNFLTGTNATDFLFSDYLRSVGKTQSGGSNNPYPLYK